jgi:hypothetical protein
VHIIFSVVVQVSLTNFCRSKIVQQLRRVRRVRVAPVRVAAVVVAAAADVVVVAVVAEVDFESNKEQKKNKDKENQRLQRGMKKKMRCCCCAPAKVETMIRKIVVVVDDASSDARVAFGSSDVFEWLRVCARTALLDALSRAFQPRDVTHIAVAVGSTGVRSQFAVNSTTHIAAALNNSNNGKINNNVVDGAALINDAMRMLWRCRVVADECAIVCLSCDAISSARTHVDALASAERNVKFTLLALTGAADRPADKYKVSSRANLRLYSLPNWSELDAVARKAIASLAVGANAAAAAVAAAAAATAAAAANAAAAAANTNAATSVAKSLVPAAISNGDDVRVDLRIAVQLGHQRVRARIVPLGPCDSASARQLSAIVARQPVFSIVGFCFESDLLAGPVSAFPLPFALQEVSNESAAESAAALLLRGLGMALADEASCAILQVSLSRDARTASAHGVVTHAVLRPPVVRGGWPVLVFARDSQVSFDQPTTWAELVATVSALPQQQMPANLVAAAAPVEADADDAGVTPKRKRTRPLSATKQAALAKEEAGKLAEERAAASLYAGLARRDENERLTPTRVIAEMSNALSPAKIDNAAFAMAFGTLKVMADAMAWPMLRDVMARAERMRSNMEAMGESGSGTTAARSGGAPRRVRVRRARSTAPTTLIKIPARATKHMVSETDLAERRRERRRERERQRRAEKRRAGVGGESAALAGDQSDNNSSGDESSEGDFDDEEMPVDGADDAEELLSDSDAPVVESDSSHEFE